MYTTVCGRVSRGEACIFFPHDFTIDIGIPHQRLALLTEFLRLRLSFSFMAETPHTTSFIYTSLSVSFCKKTCPVSWNCLKSDFSIPLLKSQWNSYLNPFWLYFIFCLLHYQWMDISCSLVNAFFLGKQIWKQPLVLLCSTIKIFEENNIFI